ncbi:MAG: hypothetical protein R3F41_20115 [Gammaproteobacteria bacterium]|nr:hypothetical protein [Pseudomonadales bacterium]MCP5346453.1 hypothetical protein [Pseudomonadales bacterium]
MKFQPRKMSAIALGVAMGVSAMATQAAEQPTFPAVGLKPNTVFSGGATINGGASYLTEIPAADAVDVIATIKPDASDVGKTGGLIIAMDVPGIGVFSRVSGGIWLPVDLNDLENTLFTYKTKTLEAEEKVSILEGLVGEDTNLTGLTFSIFLAYLTDNNLQTLTFTGEPIQFSISEPPAAGCPANTTSSPVQFNGKPVCVIAGASLGTSSINEDTHLTANNVYFLDGAVRVGTQAFTANENKITLTIDAGTTIVGNTESFLLIDRSARIMANGTPENPIIMTSEFDEEGSTEIDPINDRALWGGVILNGQSRLNSTSGIENGEGDTGEFGGGLDNVNLEDDSGSLTYLQIRYAGQIFNETDELNALALQAVGSKTNIDFVNIHNGADDGIEFYGGTPNAKHLVVTGVDDDAIDWTLGWSGKLQHVVAKMTTSGDNCIEADTLDSNNVAQPRAIPTISNFTCIGSLGQKGSGHAMELKEGTGMRAYNMVVGGEFPSGTGSAEGCILIRKQPTFDLSTGNGSISGLNGTLVMENSLITPACAADLQGASTAAGSDFTTTNWFAAQQNSSSGTVDLGGPSGWANGWGINAVEPNIPADSFFDEVDYIGAVRDDTSDWTKGWVFDYEAAAGN